MHASNIHFDLIHPFIVNESSSKFRFLQHHNELPYGAKKEFTRHLSVWATKYRNLKVAQESFDQSSCLRKFAPKYKLYSFSFMSTWCIFWNLDEIQTCMCGELSVVKFVLCTMKRSLNLSGTSFKGVYHFGQWAWVFNNAHE